MYINYIKLRNFRSYKSEVIFNLKKGINVIIGKNGIGKTSAIKAIRLLLLDKSSSNLEELVNRESTSFFIEVDFSHLGHSYKTDLKYNLKSKISERTLYIDGEQTPSYNTVNSVKDFLKTVLDPDLSYYAVALHQGSSEIIKAKDSARLELFKKIRNVDFNKQAEEIKVEYDNLFKEDLNKIDVQLVALQNKVYNYSTKEDLPFSDLEIEAFNSKIESLIIQINSLEQKKILEQELESLVEQLSNLSIEKVSQELESIKLIISNLKNKSFSNEKILITELENKEIVSNTEHLKNNFEVSSKENKNKQVSLQEKIDKIVIARIRIIDFSDDILQLNKKITELKTEKKQIKETLESLASGVCPICGKKSTQEELGKYQLALDEKNLLIDGETANLEVLLKNQEENRKQVKENEQEKERKQDLQNELLLLKNLENTLKIDLEKSLLAEEENYKNLIKANQEKIRMMKESLKKEEENLQSSIKLNEEILSKTLSQKEEIENRKKGLNESISSYKEKLLKFSNTPILDLTIEKEILDKKVSKQKDIISRNTQIVDSNKKIDLEKEEDKKRYTDFLKEKDIVNNKILQLKEARNILLKHFPNYIISSSIESIENSMNDFINTTYTKPLNISLRSTAVSLKMEYGKERKLSCSNLSGAEEALTSLAFIDSLNKQLELGFIFLDEVDAPLNRANTKTLFEAIQNMDYNQIVIITHNQYFQSKLETEGAKIFEITEYGIT